MQAMDLRMPASTGTSRVLITSALPYINGIKHLGTLVGSQLPAVVEVDKAVLARGLDPLDDRAWRERPEPEPGRLEAHQLVPGFDHV